MTNTKSIGREKKQAILQVTLQLGATLKTQYISENLSQNTEGVNP
jgi:hypothetical protein